jgi:hypothetical protein
MNEVLNSKLRLAYNICFVGNTEMGTHVPHCANIARTEARSEAIYT